jgi:hypothetical protein
LLNSANEKIYRPESETLSNSDQNATPPNPPANKSFHGESLSTVEFYKQKVNIMINNISLFTFNTMTNEAMI